jgi:hypothetical protein
MTGQKTCEIKMAYNINQNIEMDSNQITSSGIYFKSLLKADIYIKSFIMKK